jgi:hypothetical protein
MPSGHGEVLLRNGTRRGQRRRFRADGEVTRYDEDERLVPGQAWN